MALFTPVRRWQPPFLPFKRQKFSLRLLAWIERIVKGPLFGCRMCGNCLLQETAFICPMECPKGLRNGPCGGSTPEYCYVDKTRKCVWYLIYRRAFSKGREEKLMEVLPPLDWEKVGGETWADVVRQLRKTGTWKFFRGMLSRNPEVRDETWEKVFRPVRQPEWWNGDAVYHPPANHEPAGSLEKRLKNGEFVFTTEVIPPLHSDISRLKKNIEAVKPFVSALNFTDNSAAVPRMSGQACCKVAASMGADPVLQLTGRDNNRYSLQAKALGANMEGIKNILCITGDSPVIGSKPTGSLEMFDLDAVQMLWILRRMRDEGKYLDGREIKCKPSYFLGAAASPFASKPKYQAWREHKKVNAGAQFLQTNLIFDVDGLEEWLEELYRKDILDKVYIIVGIAPLRSLRMANHLRYEVPGVVVPDSVVRRIEKAGDEAGEEGIQIALELTEKIRKMRGVNGIHITTMGCESTVERIVRESGAIIDDTGRP